MQREGLDTRMSKIAIVTDSNSGITQAEGARRGIHVLPMPFMIDEVTYYEDIDLTQEQFYEKLNPVPILPPASRLLTVSPACGTSFYRNMTRSYTFL